MFNHCLTKRWVWCLLILMSVLTVCSRAPDFEQAPQPATVANIDVETRNTLPTATATIEPTPAATSTATMTSTPTATATATVTLEPSATPTPEARPTYDVLVYGNLDEIIPDQATVLFWHPFERFPEQKLLEIVAEFNTTNVYGIVVEARYEGRYSEINEKMAARILHGEDLPGLVAAFPNQAADYQSAGALLSLEPYLNHPVYGLNDEAFSDFFPAVLAGDRQPESENQLFGFPLNRSMELLFYNADWLAELPLDFAGPPQTPEQFEAAACLATNPGSGVVGYQIEPTTANFVAWIFAFGGEVYDAERGLFTFNTAEAAAAMAMLQRLLEQGCATVAEGFNYQVDFGNRKTLFGPGSSRSLYFYDAAVATSRASPFTWTVAALPHVTSEPVQYLAGPSVSIPRTDPISQLAAWLFLQYFTSNEVQVKWSHVNDNLPARAGVAGGLSDYFIENPAYEAAFSLLPYAKSPPPAAGHFAVWRAMVSAYGRILAGEDAGAILSELDEVINE